MQETAHITATDMLRRQMESLLYEVLDMQVYLSEDISKDEHKQLPLGTVGQIMSVELQDETLRMIDEAEKILMDQAIDSWEKTRISAQLSRKVSALMLFMRIIAQLPASDDSAYETVTNMVARVSEQCKKIEAMLAELRLQVLSQPS